MLSLILAVLGLCLGSFVNALVWRLREQGSAKSAMARERLSITKGRSMCVRCGHELAWYDLIPVVSWLWLRGRCRYCHQPISWQYPLVELAAAAVFVLSYLLWPVSLQDHGNLTLFVTWLICSVGLLALAVYDLRWMILPNRIIYSTLTIAVIGQLIYLIGYSPHKGSFIGGWLAALAIASGFFWLLFMASNGRWIGFGDVRLGLITGTLLQTPGRAVLMIFFASVLGSLVSLPLIAAGKKSITGKLPFGPFLITATFICLLAGDPIINWYKNLFLN